MNVQVDFCESSPCQNGGVCNPLEAGHSCACPQGYSGRNCEFFGYDCDSDPCQNGGSCQPLDAGGYFCHCPPGQLAVLACFTIFCQRGSQSVTCNKKIEHSGKVLKISVKNKFTCLFQSKLQFRKLLYIRELFSFSFTPNFTHDKMC